MYGDMDVQAFRIAGGGSASPSELEEQLLASTSAGTVDSNALVECRHCEDFVELGKLDWHDHICSKRPHAAVEETKPCFLCSLPIPVSKMNAHVNACLDKSQ